MKIQIQILSGLDFLDFPNPSIQSFQALNMEPIPVVEPIPMMEQIPLMELILY